MDNDYNSPIAKHFEDDRLDLNDDATLWLSFSPLQQHVSFSVYDRSAGDSGEHTFTFKPGMDVKAFAQDITARYGVKVPAKMTKLVQEFVILAPSIIALNANLDEGDADGNEHGYSCEQCGDWNEDTVEAFYAPATAFLPASLAFHWEYGCFGGDGFSGLAEDVLDEAKDRLTLAAGQAKSEDVAQTIREFMDSLPA